MPRIDLKLGNYVKYRIDNTQENDVFRIFGQTGEGMIYITSQLTPLLQIEYN